MTARLPRLLLGCALLATPLAVLAHDAQTDVSAPHSHGRVGFTEELRRQILEKYRPTNPEPEPATAGPSISAPVKRGTIVVPRQRDAAAKWFTSAAGSESMLTSMLFGSLVLAPNAGFDGGSVNAFSPPAGNGLLMTASFGAFRPGVRVYNDANYFYVESDSMPDATLMPTPMVGITAWQQQLPIPVGYFGNVTNPEMDTASLGYGQPNVWRIPLVPVPAAAPISLTGNFLRGAVALGVNGIPIFNPRNNTGQFSQAIGELDAYGGHCGRADDYHYHIAPTHLYAVLTPDKPCAWALDGYPIYGYLEPDGSAQQALDVDGGHIHGTWGYHYHARGSVGAGPQSPYLMNAMHGTVVNYNGQIDPQPTASSIAPAGAPLAGAVITGFARPAPDSYALTYTVSGTPYTVTYAVNRIAHTVTVTHPTPTTPNPAPAIYTSASRFNYYPMAPWSMAKLPDTGQTLSATAIFGEDSDYTRNAPSFTDNGNGTVTDNNTGLVWQKTDSGEMTWDNARTGATSLNLAGYTDWRLPTAQEAFCILDHERNPSLNSTYFVNNASGTPGYFWSSDLFYGDNTKVWCANSGGGLGPHNKTATISAGGTARHHARYVRGQKPTTGHHYLNNNDGTITDLDTSLMWTQVPSSAQSWSSALSYAEGLTTAGFSDWRLPNVKELQSLQDIPRATASGATANPCINRVLFPSATPTAYWSSTSLKSGSPTQAWLVDFGVTTTSTPSRNQQGIVSYEPYASTYPVFAVRTAAVTRSITQGLATTTTGNLLPAGQRISSVGSITATDSTVWTVPSATQFTTATKAPDLYNEVNAVTPGSIAAAATAIANAPTVVVDADGEVITGYIFADNYFELYVNGVLVGVDPVPFTPFNSCFVKFRAKKPITYAVKLVDWEENLGVGSELNGADPYHPGDGGFMASFSDGTVTNSQWKAQSFYIAPLNDPALVIEQPNGTHDSSAAGLQTPTLNQNSYALHYAIPSNWASKTFNDAVWPNASTYTEATVGVNNKPAYTNFPAQFSTSGASFIWSSNLVLDNEVIVRYTGPASVQQIAVEQPSGTPLTDGSSTVAYGSVNVGSTLSKTFVIRNNSATTALNITGATIDGGNASNFTVTTSPASSIAASGNTTMVVQFAPTTAGAKAAAIHIASSDASVGAAFDINLTGTGATTPPTITNVTTNPAVPSNTDTPYVTATVTPGSGATISSVQLTYSTGAQSTGPVFREIFSNGSTASGLAGAMNAWTATAVRAPADVRQRGATGNRTVPIVLTSGATNGTTTVTCATTTGLIPGMLISGTNIPSGATISSVTNSTTFVINCAATGSGTGLSLTAAGVTLTGCTTTSASNSVTCLSTNGLVVGMGVTGATTNPPNPVVATITPPTTFTLNNNVTTGASNVTLTASGTGLEFNNGTANYTDTMATTGLISATAPTAGNVEFWVRNADLISNNGWTFQISPDGGTTWNTRMSENFAASTATNCTFNATATVLCSNTSGLTVGNSIQGIPISVASCTTNATTTVTTVNTGSLAVGMFITGPNTAGIPNNTRITAISPGVNFTISAAATLSATSTLTANYLPGNATVSAIAPNVFFTLNAAAFYNGSGITLASINHGFQLKRYDLVAADMSANMRMRFQMSGYSGAVGPARAPAVDIDDIVVTLTTGATPVSVTMFDDGLHGDGAAGDGVYGVQLPAQIAGTTVSYSISATDSTTSTTTLTSAGSYTTAPAPMITTNATLPNATPNVAYSTTLAATGGSGGNVWSLVSGALPAGLNLSGAGVINGTTAAQGAFNVTIKVTDSAGRIATKAFTLNVTTATAPNIVIILTDDQGWGDIGYHTPPGEVPIQTPHMDSFLTKGIRLEKFYATPVCSITRACLLTGRNTIRTATGNNRGLDLSEHIMPQTFKAAGYQTYMCGKWHIGGWANNVNTATLNGSTFTVIQESDAYLPHNRGWDVHYGQYGGAINYFTHRTNDPGLNNRVDWWLNGITQDETTDLQGNGGQSTDLLADKAVSLIQNRDPSKPLLLYLAFNAVHAGVAASQSYITKYQNLGITNAARRTLAAAVDCMDVAMGRVLGALDTAGIANNTIVVFMSDNGGNEPTGSINDPLRGTKNQDSYDGGNIHTPAAIRWPGVLATGVVSNQYVWIGDIFPTLCAATGVTPQNTKPLDGLNLWPALQSIDSGNPDGPQRPSTLVTSVAKPAAFNIFTDPVVGGSKMYKLIRTRGTPVINELFNMTDDAYETTDLMLGANAASYSAIVTALTTSITNITPENYPPHIGEAPKTQSLPQGSSITLYAPFTSYGKVPSVQWRKNNTPISGANSYYQITDAGTPVNGVFMATLTLTNLNSTNTANYSVTVSSTNGSVTSGAGALTVIKPVSTQNDGLPDSWKTANGIDPNSSAPIDGPLGDIEKDGRSNLLEYAFNTNPNAFETNPIFAGIVTKAADGLNYLEVTYPRRIGALDLLYTVEISNDLQTWPSPGAAYEVVSIVPIGDGITEDVTVRILPAAGTAGQKFARVKVTTQ